MSVNSGKVTFEGKSYRVSKENRLAAELAHQSTPDSWKAKKNVVSVTDSTLAPTVGQSGTIFTLNRSAGITVTLPAAAAGLEYEFHINTTFTGTLTINSADATTDTLQGLITQGPVDCAVATNAGATTAISGPAAADHQFVADGNTKPRFLGTYLKYTCPLAGKWVVTGIGITAGSSAHPFT